MSKKGLYTDPLFIFFIVLVVFGVIFWWRVISRFPLQDYDNAFDDQVEVGILDRNNNTVPDTLEVTFEVTVPRDTVLFGGIELSAWRAGKKLFSQNIVEEEVWNCHKENYDFLQTGQNTCTRYMYIPQDIEDEVIDRVQVTLLGSDSIVSRHTYHVQPVDLSQFEYLPIGW